jgi:hypothetical protein
LPTAQLKKVLADAKQKPVLLERISLLSEDITLLNKRIAVKDSIISSLDSKDRNNDGIIRGMEDQKRLLRDEITLCQNQVKTLEAMYKRERRKRFWTGVAGSLTTVGALFLLTQK